MSVLIFGGTAQARRQALAILNEAELDAYLSDLRDGESVALMASRFTEQTAEESVDFIILLSAVEFRHSPQGDPADSAGPTNPTSASAPGAVTLDQLETLADFGRLVCVTAQQLTAPELLALMRVGVCDVQAELTAPAVTHWSHRFQKCHGAGIDRLAQTQRSREAQHFKDLQRDQRAGRHVQMGMLPPSPMAIDQYRLRHQIWPSLMLSGDFVDYFEISAGHFAFYVADVAGHGASSAFVTVLLKNFSRRLRREFAPSMLNHPGEILNWLNSELLDNGIDKHVAILCGTVNTTTNRLELANAGHFPPAILIRPGSAAFVEQPSKPAGLFTDVDYHSDSIDLAAGDALMVVSDGLFEHLAGNDLVQHEHLILSAARQCDKDSARFWQLLGCDPETASADDITWFLLTRDA